MEGRHTKISVNGGGKVRNAYSMEKRIRIFLATVSMF
jgi:hypothetical protein